MILKFKQSKYPIGDNSFATLKDVKLDNAPNHFAYLRRLKSGRLVAQWYHNFKYTDTFHLNKKSIAALKPIQPYCLNGKVSGEIWRNAYKTLVNEMDENTGFMNIEVEPLTFKRKLKIKDKVIITNGKFLMGFQVPYDAGTGIITNQIDSTNYHVKLPVYLNCPDGSLANEFSFKRCELERIGGDTYQLLSVKCSQCEKILIPK